MHTVPENKNMYLDDYKICNFHEIQDVSKTKAKHLHRSRTNSDTVTERTTAQEYVNIVERRLIELIGTSDDSDNRT